MSRIFVIFVGIRKRFGNIAGVVWGVECAGVDESGCVGLVGFLHSRALGSFSIID